MNNQPTIVEASELGWQPGYFQRFVNYNGRFWTESAIERSGGDIVAIHYRSNDGRELVVLND